MKMIVDETYLETDDDENDKCDCWDIEDRLYEQYKEMRLERTMDEGRLESEQEP